jgi:cell division protease FtsH
MSNKVGNISFYDSSGQSDFGFTKPYSEKTAEIIDHEVKDIIDESYLRAKEILKGNMKGLIELAELLLEKEVIFSEDLERIYGKRKADLVKEEKETQDKKALENKKDEKEDEPVKEKEKKKKDSTSKKSKHKE